MSGLGQWLLKDEQKTLFDCLFAAVLAIVFLALAALVLWPLRALGLVPELAIGYGVLWVVVGASAVLTAFAQKLLRIDIDSSFNAYVISGLVVSGLIQVAWCAFAAVALEPYVTAAGAWGAALLYLIGFVSCYVALMTLAAFYAGAIYRFVNLGIALIAYVLFSIFPGAARAIY